MSSVGWAFGGRSASVLIGVCGCAAMLAAGQAGADQREEHGARIEGRHEGPGFHGDIGRFHEHDWGVWHSGHWEHVDHDGRRGWWWIAGGAWFYYPVPVYPYPNPYEPPVIIETPRAAEVVPPPPTPVNWYYCESARGYYPYVSACPEGWRTVPANPDRPGSK